MPLPVCQCRHSVSVLNFSPSYQGEVSSTDWFLSTCCELSLFTIFFYFEAPHRLGELIVFAVCRCDVVTKMYRLGVNILCQVLCCPDFIVAFSIVSNV